MIKIGDFSKICRVPVSALRYYADIGLLEPVQVDRFTGYRYYDLDQLPKLNRILALRDLGLSIEQIAHVLRDDLPAEQIRGMLKLRQAEIRQTIEDEQARLARVQQRLRLIEQEGEMPNQDVILKKIEPQYALTIREVVPTPQDVGTLLGESFMASLGQGVQTIAPPFCIFHDEEFKPANMDVEIALPVAKSVAGQVALAGGRRLTARDVAGIEVAACIVHVGDFSALSSTYETLGKWVNTSGYQFAGPSREVYLRAPGENEAPITEIQMPVTKQ